jgi:2,5-diamino-6-(ribosylamino)-4(3H)-pyrimidinone 5'-phosphate reductase
MHVVAHVAVGLDGGTQLRGRDGAALDRLAATWDADVVLAGADTVLAREHVLREVALPGADLGGPLLAVVDSRDRVSTYDALARCGRFRDAIGLRGAPRVDLRDALDRLGRDHGARTVRVASGGGLIGALLEDRLLDEVSLLVHPVLAPGPRWWGRSEVRRAFAPLATECLDDGLVWLRYAAAYP